MGTDPIYPTQNSGKWGLSPFIALAVFLAACASRPEDETFRRVMDRQVGKHADDADFYPALYRLRLANVQRLANGHTREEYAAGVRGKCRLFFDLAPDRRVMAWKTEGEGDCVIPRPGRTG